MTALSSPVLRRAFRLLSALLVLQQIGLALLVFLLYVAWLHVPDASTFEVAGSVVLALVVIAVAGGGESAIVLRLAGRARTPSRLVRGALLIVAGAALWFAWATFVAHVRGDYSQNDGTLAGYLNSRFPHQLRHFFSYERLLLWIGWMWMALDSIIAGVIALLGVAVTTSAKPMHAIAVTIRSFTYWVMVVLCGIATVVVSSVLLGWTPGHGLRVEMLSLAFRLSLTVLINALLVCFLLTTASACVLQADAAYPTPAGTPLESQPRTAEIP